MHGFGAPGTDLLPLWRQLIVPPLTRFAFPEAPLRLELEPGLGLGSDAPRAWWMIDVNKLEAALMRGELRDLTRDSPEGLPEARAQVLEMLDEIERETGVSGGQVVLGGFSQGAMLALDVALHSERPLAGLVLMSSTLLAEDDWIPRMPARAGLRVFQSHGRMDPLLPFPIAERLCDELRYAGLGVRFVPFNGGHEISSGVLDQLCEYLDDVLTGQ